MKGVSLTNSYGPAINSQSSKNATIHVVSGTTYTLVDGITYDSSSEDQKGTFFSEGQLSFLGTGIQNITGSNKHGIVADEYIYVSEATINIKSAAKDGLHANDYFIKDSGTVSVTSLGDGVESQDGYISINGGTFSVNSVGYLVKASYAGIDLTIFALYFNQGRKSKHCDDRRKRECH